MTLQNGFDDAVATFFNQFVQRSWAFDQAVAFLSVNHLVKGGVLMAILWWCWFRAGQGEQAERGRDHIVATLASCVVALAIVRVMILALPFRERPLNEPALLLRMPHGVDGTAFDGLSSFPSDHATLFFALATGLFFVSRRAGLATLAYVALGIALPRLYLGLHYASDIAVGALVGTAVTIAGNRLLVRSGAVQRLRGLSATAPQYFYPALFLVTYQIADLFDGSRAMVAGVGKLVKHVVG